jgi:hypothetical protein
MKFHTDGAIKEPLVPYGRCVFATWEWCVLYRSSMGAMCPCGGHMVPSRRWMVPYVRCMQHIGVTGTMWEPYGSCVGRMGSGWCHAPSVGHMGTACIVWEVDGLWEPFGSILEADGNIWELIAPYWGHMGAVCLQYGSCVGAVWKPFCTIWEPEWCQL